MINRLIVLLSALCLNPLFGTVEDNLSRGFDKSDPQAHQMANIDFIYMINLDSRPEKFASCAEQLSPYGIYPFRVSAVDGRKLTLDVINDVGVTYEPWMESGHLGTSYLPGGDLKPFHDILHVVGRNYFTYCMGRAPIAIALSHLSVLQDAYDAGYETIWVMEDDIQIIKDPNTIPSLINKLDDLLGKRWDILFTDQDTKNSRGEYVPCFSYAWRPNFTPKNPERFGERKDVSAEFRKIGARYGTYSMIVRRSGIKKILKFIKEFKIFLPYDMDFYLPNDISMYTVREDVVSTMPRALTDNNL